ncbi:MAG: UV DNA damage repair endonuclease UvsE [candidate division WOR-3 bacterium]
MTIRIGYPCINLSLNCRSTKTFRLQSYSEEKFKSTVESNLLCLEETIKWNIKHGIRFFRISSDLIPFASHPICKFPWQKSFRPQLRRIGALIRQNQIRVSMHPDQFVLINAIDKQIVINSIRELLYHAQVLDLMQLPTDAKIQIHIGGAYGDKETSIKRFARRFYRLPNAVQRRLVIENDDRLYTVTDCLKLHRLTKIPVVFDCFHHEVNPDGNAIGTAFLYCARTWRRRDGVPIVDYSSQEPHARLGSHAQHINLKHFSAFMEQIPQYDFDLMLEIKDKETSALTALRILKTKFTPANV